MHLGMQLASWTVMQPSAMGTSIGVNAAVSENRIRTTRTVLLLSTPRGRQMLVVTTTVGAPLYQSCTSRRKSVLWQLQEAFAIRRRHVAPYPPTRERRSHNPVDGAAFCISRPAGDVVDGATGAIVEAEGGLAHGWQWLQDKGSRGPRCCSVAPHPWLCRGLRLRAPTRVLRNCTLLPVMRPILRHLAER